MPLQNFIANTTPTIKAAWLNQIDAFYFTLFNSATTASAALDALGFTAFSKAFIVLATAAAARTNLGATTVGDAVFTAVNAAAAQTAIGIVTATTSAAGIVELATTAEVSTGTDTSLVPSVSSMQNGKITIGAPITLSGTQQTQTGIPAYAKAIYVSFVDVSTNGTSPITIRLGTAGGIQNTSYVGSVGFILGSSSFDSATLASGFNITNSGSSSQSYNGLITIRLINTTTNGWACSGVIGRSDTGAISFVGGTKALMAALTQVQITTVGGSDSFDNGVVNVTWE